MAIELEDALSEAYKLNPVEYRWKKPDKKAPELTDDFKWNFLAELKKPQLEISGPSVGSLLYALNPQTSELGLKQMDSELNQQLAANENFDKRGDMAMKFMEQRVAEDIADKQFADKLALEKQKIQNVDAGHANSLLANYTQAIQSGDATAIAIAEDRIRKTFPNADAILEDAKNKVAGGKVQEENFWRWKSNLPGQANWKNREQRDKFINDVEGAMKNGEINIKQGYELIGEANRTSDWQTIRSNAVKQAHAINTASKSVNKTNADDKETWIKKYMKKTGKNRVYATRAYQKEFGE